MQCVAVCCGVLRCVAVCCSVSRQSPVVERTAVVIAGEGLGFRFKGLDFGV